MTKRYWFGLKKRKSIKITHYSYFENWNSYNYMLAKENMV